VKAALRERSQYVCRNGKLQAIGADDLSKKEFLDLDPDTKKLRRVASIECDNGSPQVFVAGAALRTASHREAGAARHTLPSRQADC
jgi:hypothetical protein